MNRFLMLLTVVALMMVMLAMSVAPAFAAMPYWTCSGYGFTVSVPAKSVHYYRAADYTCVKQ